MSFAEAEDGSKLPVGPIMLLMIVCVAITLVVGLATSFGIILLLRLNGSIDTKLSVLLIPMWILDCILLLCLYAAFAGARSRAAQIGVVLAQLVGFVIFQLLLALKVDGSMGASYAVVFTPLFIVEGVLAARTAMGVRPQTYDGEIAAGNTLLSYPLYVARAVGWELARALTLLLMPLRLDLTITCAWTVVLLPLWALVVLEFSLACVSARTDSTSERAPVLKQLALTRAVVTVFVALMLLLLCVRLDAHTVSWVSIFWPLFVASSIYFCCCCCLCCALSLAPRAEVRDVPPPESGEYTKEKSERPSESDSRSSTFDRPDLRNMKQGESTPLMAAQHGEGYKSGGTVSPPDDGA